MRPRTGIDIEKVRRVAQVVLAAIAVLAAAAAALLYFGGWTTNPFAKRVEAVPPRGPVGMRPFFQLIGYRGDAAQQVYLCVGANDPIGECIGLASGPPADRLRSKPVPATFPSGDDVVPQTYALRVGPDDDGLFPMRGTFEVIAFEIGAKARLRSFAGVGPEDLRLGPPKEVANRVACRPPIWMPDGRLSVGNTVVDPETGVTTDLNVGVAVSEMTWSPSRDKLAILTADRKEIRLAGPDGVDPVTKVREARGLLSGLSWSAQGDRLAYIAQNDPNTRLGPGPPTVKILNSINGDVTGAGPGLWVAWAPKGDLLAVQMSGGVIELGDPAGGRRRLTTGRFPSWSPDERLLAFVRGDETSSQGWVSTFQGERPTPVGGGATCALSFSPSGEDIAIVEARGGDNRLVVRSIER